MIIVYPMLTSSTINPSVLPGIAKAMELHILINKLNDIPLGGQSIKIKGNKYVTEEIDQLIEQRGPGTKTGGRSGGGGGMPSKPTGSSKPEIGKPNTEAVGVSPTYVNVYDSKSGQMKILGIKVVPFPVSEDTKISDLLTSDKATKNWLNK